MAAAVRTPRSFLRTLAIQDWVVLFYLCALLFAVLQGSGPRRQTAILCVLADLAAFSAILALTRGGVLSGVVRTGLYRIGFVVGILGSFFQLQYILPTASPRLVDAQLYAFDLRVFGLEPAEAWDRFVTPATTEWFSFFYFGYFGLLASYVFSFMLLVRRGHPLSEISLGIAMVFCTGHLLYMVVPGHGPYEFLAAKFQHDLEGPRWWRLVADAVSSVDGGARTDIFPSLHTATPTFLWVFAARNRQHRILKWVWAPTLFFASQIVLATMFLRWHYLVDVCAGLVLGLGTGLSVRHIVRWESARRAALGVGEVWDFGPAGGSAADLEALEPAQPTASRSL